MHPSIGEKQVLCLLSLWWRLLLVLRLQLIRITWLAFVGWWMYNSILFSVDLRNYDWRRKSVGTEHNDLAARAVGKYSYYCSTLGHISHILRFFFSFSPLFLSVFSHRISISSHLVIFSNWFLCVFTSPQWKQYANLIEHKNPF